MKSIFFVPAVMNGMNGVMNGTGCAAKMCFIYELSSLSDFPQRVGQMKRGPSRAYLSQT